MIGHDVRFDLQGHADKAGNTALANAMFQLRRRHETWYRKNLAGARQGLGQPDEAFAEVVDTTDLDQVRRRRRRDGLFELCWCTEQTLRRVHARMVAQCYGCEGGHDAFLCARCKK